MLEKARMKGKKQPLPATQPALAGNTVDEEFDDDEDDGLCCTCGQHVGQHNHVPPEASPPSVAHGHHPVKTK